MSTVQRIAKNTTVLLVAQVASYFLAFFYIMYTARYLGPTSFGILSFALAFTGIFGVFGDLGLRPLTVREVARNKSLAPKYLANVSLMKIILVAVTFGLIALTINLMGYPEETIKVVYLLALFVIFQTFTQMFYSIFQAFERMEYQGIGQMLNVTLLLGGVIFAIKNGFTVVGFASLYVVASIIVLGYSFALMKLKFPNPSLASATKAVEFDWSFWKPTIKKALPFCLTIIAGVIFLRIDIIMLSVIKGDAAAGWYNAACNLIIVLVFIADAFIYAVFPNMARFFISARDSLKMALERSSKYLFIVGLPLAVGTILLADRIIPLIYGAEFAPAVAALRILSLYLPLRFVSHATGWTLAAINREPLRTLSAGIAAGTNISLNLLLIPSLGLVGAAVSTVITQILLFTLYFYFVAKHFHRLPLHRMIIKPSIACLMMGIFVFFLRQANLPLLVALAALIYFGMLYLLKTFDTDDRKMFHDVVKGLARLLPPRATRP